MAKQILLAGEGQDKLQKGINLLAEAVGSTLGPHGRPVIIASGYGHAPIVTKDGVTVAKSFFIDDEVENAGAFLIREAASKTLDTSGDGTTTSTVLAQSIINQGLDAVKDGANPQKLKLGIEKATNMIVESLKAMSIPVSNNEIIKSVATISANNDEEIGGKIAEAYDKMGLNGYLSIDKSQTIETYVDVKSGAEMINGYANDLFVTDKEKMLVEYENPMILVADYEIKTVKELEPLMESLMKDPYNINFTVTPLIIIAKGFEGEPYNTMIHNKVKNGCKFCLIQAPSAYQRETLRDVATITGAKIISSDNGNKVENACYDDLGGCKKIVVSKSSTFFIEGLGGKEDVELLQLQISNLVKNEANPVLKEIWEKRLARLLGSIGVIYVGGATDVEQKERHDRVDDANRAVKSAIEEGVVPGGGIALIRCGKKIDFSSLSGDELLGAKIVFNSCTTPLIKMLSNAGLDSEGVFGKIYIQEDTEGYNVKTEQFVDMVKENILDPTKVVRCALLNASSVACQVITAGALMIEMKPQ